MKSAAVCSVPCETEGGSSISVMAPAHWPFDLFEASRVK
jgi:hypothetical protein